MLRFLIAICFLIAIVETTFGQEVEQIEEVERGLFMRSVNFQFGVAFFDNPVNAKAPELQLGITFDYHKHLFTPYIRGSQTIAIFSSDKDILYEAGILYGRALKIFNWLKVEGHAGPGIFFRQYKDRSTQFNSETTAGIGYTGKLNVLFYHRKNNKYRFGFGPTVSYNYNGVVTNTSVGLLFIFNL